MNKPPEPPRPPRIAGFTYIAALGSGGGSYVYLYSQDRPHRMVAVKTPRAFGPDPVTHDRFVAEANAMARLQNHNNIVPVHDFVLAEDGTPCLVMAYYKDGDLAKLVKGRGLPLDQALEAAEQLGRALAAAHEVELLHQDVKPANVLIDSTNGGYRLGDFGIATRLGPRAATEAFSPSWAAPEVVAGGDATMRSDLYSLGATVWHLLAGYPPFVIPGGDNSPAGLRERTLAGSPAPAMPRSDVPEPVLDLLRRMMAPAPRDRPSSAAQVARELAGLRSGRSGGSAASGASIEDTVMRGAVVEEADRTVFRAEAQSDTGSLLGGGSAPRPAQPAAARVPPPIPVEEHDDTEAVRTVMRRPDGSEGSSGGTGTAPAGARPRSARALSRPAVIGIAAAVVLAGVVATATLAAGPAAHGNASGQSTGPVLATGAAGGQDAGNLGDDEPPGPVTVSATRTGTGTLRFTWTYSAAMSTDSFRWRTSTGTKSGTSAAAWLDLADPTGRKLCVEVKVVRMDGSFGDPDWSAAGCGQ